MIYQASWHNAQGSTGLRQSWNSNNVGTLRWRVGDATILRLAELDVTAALQGLIREFDLADISRAGWLTPDFVDAGGRLRGQVQAFLIMIAGQVIIIDPGVGNGKKRTAVAGWNDLNTDFLDQLRATGVEPDQVDYVVNTHLHFDHVGWHTQRVGGAWQPTFPAARYVMSAGEFRYWQSRPEKEIADQHAGFSDSVLPVKATGLVYLVADDHFVTDGVRLVPAPGHTPHHVSVMIEPAGHSAMFTGDAMHHPRQIALSELGSRIRLRSGSSSGLPI